MSEEEEKLASFPIPYADPNMPAAERNELLNSLIDAVNTLMFLHIDELNKLEEEATSRIIVPGREN